MLRMLSVAFRVVLLSPVTVEAKHHQPSTLLCAMERCLAENYAGIV